MWFIPSLEIIETRGNLTEQLALALADNAQQKTVILGSPVPLPATSGSGRGTRRHQRRGFVATGAGNAVLGNPLNSVVWLAAKLAEFGRSLKAGEIIMSGSFTRQFPIRSRRQRYAASSPTSAPSRRSMTAA